MKHAMRIAVAVPLALALASPRAPVRAQSAPAPKWDRSLQKKISELATRWWQARPATRFETWDADARSALVAQAKQIGAIPEGKLDDVVALLWEPVGEFGPGIPKQAGRKRGRRGKATRPKWLPKPPKRKGRKRKPTRQKAEIPSPYGDAWFWADDPGGGSRGLILGLHGGGEGSGSADGPRGVWTAKDCIGFYPQGIKLVHDTWNTVHGERFLLTLIEIAKAHWDVDPDRVYSMGFSMGGSGSWFMAGRHADLLAGAAPCAGVLMASPKSQLATKAEVTAVQHGLVPNVRNLAMYYYIGLADRNCMPGTYLFVADMLERLRAEDAGGYDKIRFTTYEGLAHAQPPGEPQKLLQWLTAHKRGTFPDTVAWEVATDPFPQAEASEPVARLPKTMFYWLGCTEQTDRQVVRAKLDRATNEITLDVQRRPNATSGITLFLNDRMIDPARPVVVKSGQGATLYEGKPVPDLWTVLETLDARVDRKMLFDRRIAL